MLCRGEFESRGGEVGACARLRVFLGDGADTHGSVVCVVLVGRIGNGVGQSEFNDEGGGVCKSAGVSRIGPSGKVFDPKGVFLQIQVAPIRTSALAGARSL